MEENPFLMYNQYALKVPWHGVILLFYNVPWVGLKILVCFLDQK